jgi:hypothetical protein
MVRLDALTTEFERRVGLYWMDNGEMKFFRAEANTQYEPADDKIYIYMAAIGRFWGHRALGEREMSVGRWKIDQ